jgi:hypothetical protein
MTRSNRTFDAIRYPDRTPPVDETIIDAAYAQVFSTREGQIVLAHLQRQTVDAALSAEISDGALRMKEGERQLYRRILGRIENGRRVKQQSGTTPE